MQRVTFQGRLVKLGKQKTLCLGRVAGLLFGFSCIWFSYLGLPSILEVWEKKRVTPKPFFSSCSVASSNPCRDRSTPWPRLSSVASSESGLGGCPEGRRRWGRGYTGRRLQEAVLEVRVGSGLFTEGLASAPGSWGLQVWCL